MNLSRLLPLFCLACSSPAGSEYHRGTTTVRPPPAPVRPGVGAPVVGQPGSFTQPARSPNARVLPPSNEPGLWSADSPKASISAELPRLLGVEVPVPEGADHIAKFHAAMCAVSLQDMASSALITKIVERLSQQEKRCLALRMHSTCVDMVLKTTSKAPVDTPARVAEIGGLKALLAATVRSVGEACLGIAYGRGDMLRAHAAVGDAWARNVRHWWRYE